MQSSANVLVTESEYLKAREVFEHAVSYGIDCVPCPPEERLLIESIRDSNAKHVILGVNHYSNSLYESLPRGSVVARFGVGFDNIDLAAATKFGLLCTNTPGALDSSVAEHAITLITAASRNLRDSSISLQEGSWSPSLASELSGKKLAIIGCGNIGRLTARIAARGFGMSVVGYKRTLSDAEQLIRDFGFDSITSDFAAAVSDADFVSLHLPSNDSTRHFLQLSRFHQMPDKAWLVNTARGAIVDECELYDALEAGIIRGAALDVFQNEPYEPIRADKDLRQLSNVLMTPHVGSSTVEACRTMASMAIHNIRLAEQGRYDQMNLLNPEVLEHEEQTSQSTA